MVQVSLDSEARSKSREKSPIYRRRVSYSEWLVRWCRQQMQHVHELHRNTLSTAAANASTRRRAELLLACDLSIRHDVQLALQLLPYIIQLLLHCHGDTSAYARELRSELESVIHPADDTSLAVAGAGQQLGGTRSAPMDHSLCCQAPLP